MESVVALLMVGSGHVMPEVGGDWEPIIQLPPRCRGFPRHRQTR